MASQLVLLAILVLIMVILAKLLLRVGFLAWVSLQGPFFARVSDERITDVLVLAEIKPSEKVVDLGSGDGAMVIGLAKTGAKVDGYEIDPVLVKQAEKNIAREGLMKNVKIYRQDFWKADTGKYDVIVVYAIGKVMNRLGGEIEEGSEERGSGGVGVFPVPGLERGEEEGRCVSL